MAVLSLGLATLVCGCGGKSGDGSASSSASPQASGTPHATPYGVATPHGDPSPQVSGTPHARAKADPWTASIEKVDKAMAAREASEARALLDESSTLAAGDPGHQAETLKRLGELELSQGNVQAGVAAFQQTVKLAKICAKPDYDLIASSYLTIGAAYFTTHRYSDAAKALERASAVLRIYKPDDLGQRKNVLTCLEQVYVAAGKNHLGRKTSEEIRLLDVQADLPIPADHPTVPWLGRQQPEALPGIVSRWTSRQQPTNRVLGESRWLARQWIDPVLASPSPTASPSH